MMLNKNIAITHDSSDPDLALNARLKTLGPVQPNPTLSASSTFNSRPPLRAPHQNASSPLKVTTSTSTSTDPSLTTSHFRPSASNPQQTIFPTSASPSSSQNPRSNPAVSLLTARFRLAAEAEREFALTGKSSAGGRRFLDVVTLRQVLVMRDETRLKAGEIERRLGLERGVVERLGERGVVGIAG